MLKKEHILIEYAPSIYLYNSIEKIEPVNESVNKSVNKSVENSVYNHLLIINDSVDNHVDGSVNMSPKKELLKRNIKKNNISKDIYVLKFNTIYKNSNFDIIT